MSVYDWSVTAANNDVADPTINWAEGQSPATVNNSSRAMMAALAKFVKDTGGAITSTGSSNSYAITTNSSLAAHTVPVLIAFRANHTSSGAATIAIDGLSGKSLLRASGAAIQSGDIVSGSVYLIAYQSTADAYYCLNVAGFDPANIAITGGTIDDVAITGGTIDGVVITATNTGLHILDTNATHDLILKPGSNLTADRTLTIVTGDADRTLTLGGDFTANGGTVSGGTHSGTNTGDQAVGTTAGTVAAGDHTHTFASLTSKPTTISGYGLTDAAAKTQVEDSAIYIATPQDKDYDIWINASYASTINEITTDCESGTCTVTGKINTTALGGTANSASTSEETQAHVSNNSMAIGDNLRITISANAACLGLQLKIKSTRTLA